MRMLKQELKVCLHKTKVFYPRGLGQKNLTNYSYTYYVFHNSYTYYVLYNKYIYFFFRWNIFIFIFNTIPFR